MISQPSKMANSVSAFASHPVKFLLIKGQAFRIKYRPVLKLSNLKENLKMELGASYNNLFLCRLSVKPHITSKSGEISFFNRNLLLLLQLLSTVIAPQMVTELVRRTIQLILP
jgi:hypothetical protein